MKDKLKTGDYAKCVFSSNNLSDIGLTYKKIYKVLGSSQWQENNYCVTIINDENKKVDYFAVLYNRIWFKKVFDFKDRLKFVKELL